LKDATSVSHAVCAEHDIKHTSRSSWVGDRWARPMCASTCCHSPLTSVHLHCYPLQSAIISQSALLTLSTRDWHPKPRSLLASYLIYARAFIEYVCKCVLFQDVAVREICGR